MRFFHDLGGENSSLELFDLVRGHIPLMLISTAKIMDEPKMRIVA